MSPIPPSQALALLLAVLVIGHDLYARRVPNAVLAGVLAVAGLWQVTVLSGLATAGTPTPIMAGLALIAGLAAMLPFYVLGWMGAGDVKLMAVLGFLLGPWTLLCVWILGNLLLGVHTILTLASRLAVRRQPQLAALQLDWERSALRQRLQRPHQGRMGMPFAAYLGMAVVFWILVAPLVGVAS